MKKLLHYAGEIWRVVSPLFIFWGVTAAVVSVFGILWIIFGRYLTFLYSYEEDVMLLLSGVAALLAAWILWKIDEREGIWYGEIRKKLPVQAVLPCIGAAVGASVAGNCLLSFLRLTELGSGQAQSILERGNPAVVVVSTCLAAPLAEEMVFRVLTYRRLRRNMNGPWAVFLSSLLFALYHGNISQGLYAFLVGMVLALLMEAYGSAAAPVLAHMAANTVSVLLTWAGTGDILSVGIFRRAAAILIFGGILIISLRRAAAYGKRDVLKGGTK